MTIKVGRMNESYLNESVEMPTNKISASFLENVAKSSNIDLKRLVIGNWGAEGDYKNLTASQIQSIANKMITHYKKNLEKIIGCKLTKVPIGMTGLDLEYKIFPTPANSGSSRRRFGAYPEPEDWYIVLGYMHTPTKKFYIALHDNSRKIKFNYLYNLEK